MIASEARQFLVALQFLTRIPVPAFEGFEASWLDRAAKYFPLVGALVGAISAVALLGAAAIFPEPIPAVIALAVGVAVTGAFHEDGLSDTADGLGGGLTREARLEIMKDSRIGTYGTVALMMALGLKGAALIALDPISAAKVLVAAHAGARLATVLAISLMTYAGDEAAAKVKPLATGLTPSELSVAVFLGVAPALYLLSSTTWMIAMLAAVVAVTVLARLCNRLIGGYTGDTLGAKEQVYETVFLLAAAAVISGPG